MTTKTKIPVADLCVKVAVELGWKYELIGLCDNYGYVNTKIWTDAKGDQVDHFDSIENAPSYVLLSPQGRELMESFVERRIGASWQCQFTEWIDEYEYLFDNDGQADVVVIHKDKHMACLLAFAQLVKVYDPEKEEVEW
jgi:hypothetical protein